MTHIAAWTHCYGTPRDKYVLNTRKCRSSHFRLDILKATAAAAKSLQSCLTLCDPIDGSPPGSPVPGILQARTLEWVAISFSNAWKWKVNVKSLSRVWLFATPWTAAYQAPPSMGFSTQEYWSGVPFPSPMHTTIYKINDHNLLYSTGNLNQYCIMTYRGKNLKKEWVYVYI